MKDFFPQHLLSQGVELLILDSMIHQPSYETTQSAGLFTLWHSTLSGVYSVLQPCPCGLPLALSSPLWHRAYATGQAHARLVRHH